MSTRAAKPALLAALALTVASGGCDRNAVDLELERLRGQVALAEGGEGAYLLAEPDAVRVMIRGVEMVRFPVRRLFGSQGAEVSRVAARVAAVDPPQVTIDAEAAAREVDKVGSVASKDEIVSVDDMPETFLVRFADGSQWFLTSDRWLGLTHAVSKRTLQYRAGFHWLKTALGPGSARLTVDRVDPGVARRLFWILHEDMAVIR